jgi:hypothetical protein
MDVFGGVTIDAFFFMEHACPDHTSQKWQLMPGNQAESQQLH